MSHPFSKQELLDYLPMKPPFRFVDNIEHVDEEGIEAYYTWKLLDADGHMGNIRFCVGYELTAEDFVSNRFFSDSKFSAGYILTQEDVQSYFAVNHLIIPGVKIIECANQVGLAAWGLYLLSLENTQEDIVMRQTLFTGTDKTRFRNPLFPGDECKIQAKFGKKGSFQQDSMVVEVVITAMSGDHEGEVVYKGVHRECFPIEICRGLR